MKPARILLVDEDDRLRYSLRSMLVEGGYEVEEARTPEHAQECLNKTCADVVMLDAKLTTSGDSRAWRKIRAKPDIALIAIATRDSEQEEVAALNAGVDDYIHKPFSAPRLLARLGAILRRAGKSSIDRRKPPVVRLENCEIDLRARRVYSRGRQIRLTPKECELLDYFIANANIPIPNAEVLEAVWGRGYGAQTDYIRTFVTHLRRKIELDPANPRHLLTEPWVGYRFMMPAVNSVKA